MAVISTSWTVASPRISDRHAQHRVVAVASGQYSRTRRKAAELVTPLSVGCRRHVVGSLVDAVIHNRRVHDGTASFSGRFKHDSRQQRRRPSAAASPRMNQFDIKYGVPVDGGIWGHICFKSPLPYAANAVTLKTRELSGSCGMVYRPLRVNRDSAPMTSCVHEVGDKAVCHRALPVRRALDNDSRQCVRARQRGRCDWWR